MKQKPWLKYLLIVLLIASGGLISSVIIKQFSTVDSKESSVMLARRRSRYDRYMALAYTANRRRQYGRALYYFRLALRQRPGDRYARNGISNVRKRLRRASRYRRVARRGRPRRRRGAATRGSNGLEQCSGLIPLIPTMNETCSQSNQGGGNSSESALFLTTAKYPTFFFYVPQISQEEELLFELEDEENGNILYELTFKPTQTPGIVSVSLPKDKPPLELNKEYRWSLSKDSDRPDDYRPEGLIKREQPNPELIKELKAAKKPLDRVGIYAKYGYWEDSLRTIADLRRQNPQDEEVNIEWGNLLATVELEDNIIDAPLLLSR